MCGGVAIIVKFKLLKLFLNMTNDIIIFNWLNNTVGFTVKITYTLLTYAFHYQFYRKCMIFPKCISHNCYITN